MLRVTGFGVQNLRSIEDSGVIGLLPINILVGKNSAGKSTFARIAPLLKQSAERKKEAPVLWYGRLVDFGSFREAVSTFASQKQVTLKFEFEAISELVLPRSYRASQKTPAQPVDQSTIVAELSLSERYDGTTYVSKLVVNVFGNVVEAISETGYRVQLKLNGEDVRLDGDAQLYFVENNATSILPTLFLWSESRHDAVQAGRTDSTAAPPAALGLKEARRGVAAFVHGKTRDETKDEIVDQLPIASAADFIVACKSIYSAPASWRNALSAVSHETKPLRALRDAVTIRKFDLLLSRLDDSLQAFANKVSYLEPLRATAQRYYRREEVSIDQLDPKGLNIAFFILGLKQTERESLTQWLIETFGFSLHVEASGGHLSLKVITLDAQPRNMADVGLGYSQIAPVAVLLWASLRPESDRSRGILSSFLWKDSAVATVVIEQPELHLHPAYQSKLADVFAKCVSLPSSNSGISRRVRLVIETHSANLVSRIGELISTGELSADSVQILVFEPDESSPEITRVRVANFDGAGILRNWPVGFFDY